MLTIKFVNFKYISYVKLNKYFSLKKKCKRTRPSSESTARAPSEAPATHSPRTEALALVGSSSDVKRRSRGGRGRCRSRDATWRTVAAVEEPGGEVQS